MPTLHAEHSTERIALHRAGLATPLLVQNAPANHRPFIHPILAPDGVGELTENEPAHHRWQHGLYVGLNDVNGVGFWTEGLLAGRERDGTFHPFPLAAPLISGNTAQWSISTEWHSPESLPLLTETQRWTLTDNGDFLVLDMSWELQAETDLRFGRYDYGGLFLRMPWRAQNRRGTADERGRDNPQRSRGKTRPLDCRRNAHSRTRNRSRRNRPT